MKAQQEGGREINRHSVLSAGACLALSSLAAKGQLSRMAVTREHHFKTEEGRNHLHLRLPKSESMLFPVIWSTGLTKGGSRESGNDWVWPQSGQAG